MTSDSNSSTVAGLLRLGLELSADVLRTAAYDVHGITTRIVTNSDMVAAATDAFMRPFKPAETERPDIEFHLFVVDGLEENMAKAPPSASMMYDWDKVKIFFEGPRRYLEVDSRARITADITEGKAVGFASEDLLVSNWLISNLFFYPLWGQLMKEQGLFPLHAAGLSRDGSGFLFLGRSGSGKSTLTLNLVQSGFGLLSDDTVFLRMTGDHVEALCFPEEINVNERTIELLPELAQVENFTVNELRDKSSFSIEELYPDSVVESTVPAFMVFPEIADAESTVVEPISRTEALALSLRYGYFFLDPSTTGRHFEIMSQLARQTDCYRLFSGRNQDELKKTLKNLVSGSLERREERHD